MFLFLRVCGNDMDIVQYPQLPLNFPTFFQVQLNRLKALMEGVFGSPATPVMAPPPASVQHRRVMEKLFQELKIGRYISIF